MARLSYSSFVRGLMVLLPLAALGLLSTLFLVARTGPNDATLPYLEELQARVGGAVDGMRTPFYTGTTEAGDAVTVRADLLTPDLSDPSTARAQSVRADIRFQDGSDLRIRAQGAEFSGSENALTLEGNVEIVSSAGYVVTTDALVTELSSGAAESRAPVQASGPPGTLEAGRLELRRHADDSVELVFTNRVKLIYQPPTRPE